MSLDKGDHGYHQDEEVIEGLQILFRETLYTLPWVSTDMQKLLKSPWLSNFPNQMAHDLFYGQKDQAEGIGSGHIEHGRLPESLFNLIEREKMGDGRNRPEESSRHEPQRRDGEARNRWGEQKSRFLRTAGRVE
jgi:hypothetical protein